MVTHPSLRRPGRAVRWRVRTLAIGSLVLAGCSEATTPDPASGLVHNPPLQVTSSPVRSSSTPAAPGGPATVRASIGVPRSRAVAALLSFVEAHAESVNSGRVTRRLVSVTTPTELARQRQVVGFAAANGYAVPTTPSVQVVSVIDRSPTLARLGACFWLPSTEYQDARTGRSPAGPVPQAWAPAVATVRLVKMTWSVDNLSKPDNQTTIRCGSTS